MQTISQKQRFEALPGPLQKQAKTWTAKLLRTSKEVVSEAIAWVLEERMPHTATPYLEEDE